MVYSQTTNVFSHSPACRNVVSSSTTRSSTLNRLRRRLEYSRLILWTHSFVCGYFNSRTSQFLVTSSHRSVQSALMVANQEKHESAGSRTSQQSSQVPLHCQTLRWVVRTGRRHVCLQQAPSVYSACMRKTPVCTGTHISTQVTPEEDIWQLTIRRVVVVRSVARSLVQPDWVVSVPRGWS